MTARTSRDPWLDNARLVAAVGVVLGHCLGSVLNQVDAAGPLWAATWGLRLPALVLLAGCFSSATPFTRASLWRLVRIVLVLFLVCDVVFAIVHGALVPGTRFSPLMPGYGLWFLISLFCWRVSLPYLVRIPHLFRWSVAASLVVGFVPFFGESLSLGRTVVWFPVFLAGHRLGQPDARRWMSRVKVTNRLRRTGAVALALAVTICLVVNSLGGLDPLHFDGPYAGSLAAQFGLAVMRAALLVAALLGVFALLVMVPRHHIRGITVLGAGSLAIYLLHSLLLPVAREWGAFDWVHSWEQMALLLVVVTPLAMLLGSPPVRGLLRPLTDVPRPAPTPEVVDVRDEAREQAEPGVQQGVLTSV